MLRHVCIQLRVWISEAELAPEQLDVFGVASQKQPTRFRSMHLGILIEHIGSVMFWFEGDRIHEDIATYPFPKFSLNLPQVRCDSQANSLAIRVHEVNNHNLVLDQIIVEPDLFAVVRG